MRKSDRDEAKLRDLLAVAARRLAAVKGLIRSDYETGSEIRQFVLECGKGIEHGTVEPAQKHELRRIFAPAGDWDNVVGDVELGEEVFALIKKLFGNEVGTDAR